MSPEIEEYLGEVRWRLKLDPHLEAQIIRELSAEIEEEVEDLTRSGVPEEEAIRKAKEALGPAEILAREIHEVYRRGSWSEALLGSLPHVLVALTFAFHLWQDLRWGLLCSAFIIGISIYGWFQKRPLWFYTWFGYSLGLLVGASFAFFLQSSISPGGVWFWLALAAFIPFLLFVLGFAALKVMNRDWPLCALILLPGPEIVGWLISSWEKEKIPAWADSHMAIIFFVLAAATFLLLRFGQRSPKAWILLSGILLPLALFCPGIDKVAFFTSAVFLAALVMSFFLLERRIRRFKTLRIPLLRGGRI